MAAFSHIEFEGFGRTISSPHVWFQAMGSMCRVFLWIGRTVLVVRVEVCGPYFTYQSYLHFRLVWGLRHDHQRFPQVCTSSHAQSNFGLFLEFAGSWRKMPRTHAQNRYRIWRYFLSGILFSEHFSPCCFPSRPLESLLSFPSLLTHFLVKEARSLQVVQELLERVQELKRQAWQAGVDTTTYERVEWI